MDSSCREQSSSSGTSPAALTSVMVSRVSLCLSQDSVFCLSSRLDGLSTAWAGLARDSSLLPACPSYTGLPCFTRGRGRLTSSPQLHSVCKRLEWVQAESAAEQGTCPATGLPSHTEGGVQCFVNRLD